MKKGLIVVVATSSVSANVNMRRLLGIILLTLSIGVLPVSAGQASAAPELDTYIVVLKPGADRPAMKSKFSKSGWRVKREYSTVLSGFAIDLSTASASVLQRNPDVLSVERDTAVTAFDKHDSDPSQGQAKKGKRTQNVSPVERDRAVTTPDTDKSDQSRGQAKTDKRTPSVSPVERDKAATTPDTDKSDQSREQAKTDKRTPNVSPVESGKAATTPDTLKPVPSVVGSSAYGYSSLFPGFVANNAKAYAFLRKRNRNRNKLPAEPGAGVNIQDPAPSWGLDRIDQRTLPLSGTFVYSATGNGAGVRAYIVDTGVLSTHSEFSGRLVAGFTAINDGRGTEDCNGHGTHVAGTVAGTIYGAAKEATIVPVRVLDCQGSGMVSGVIAGLDWIVKDHVSGPAVVNMSLGGGASAALDAAVLAVVDDGVTVVVAAGNSTADACTSSPSRVAQAVTVGATTSADARASYSNFGSCLDLFAPGSLITSAWNTATTATKTISGTSMAAPHAAGVAAALLSLTPTLSPAEVASALILSATTDVVTDARTGSPNLLLFSDPPG